MAMLRRTLLFAVVTVFCFVAFLIATPWSQDALAMAPQQAARLTSWMSYEESETESITLGNCLPLNWTKVATMIETRDSPMLIPIIQSWLTNMPSDWPFVIWTGEENHEILQTAPAFQEDIRSGRLNLTRIDLPGSIYRPDPRRTSTLSDLLGNTNWFWTQFQPEADWMLFFQVDSVLCSKSGQSPDDWLGYEFIGGPCTWTHGEGMDRLGGNGGLSLRRISALRDITTLTPRRPGEDPEDVWFTRRLRDRPETRWPEREGRPTYQFSMSQGWIEDATIDEAWSPMGLHHGSGHIGDVFESDGAGRMTNKIHRVLQSCPDFLLLRYALDEYRHVDMSKFKEDKEEEEAAAAPTTNAPPPAIMGIEPSPEMQATIEELQDEMHDLHDLTPILSEMMEAERKNGTSSSQNEMDSTPIFSPSSDDVTT